MVSTKEQIDVIVKKVQDYAKSKATEHLCQVYISLPSSERLDDIEAHLHTEPVSMFSSLTGRCKYWMFSVLFSYLIKYNFSSIFHNY